MNDIYVRNKIDMRISSPLNMVNEFMNHCFHKAKEILNGELSEGQQAENFVMVNESEIKMKLTAFLTKIMRVFNQNKKSQGRQRMIATRSLDLYYNDFEFEPLDDEIKFYVHLNRGANKMNGDLWTNAVDDLKLALAIKSDDVMANKFMATSLKKLGSYDLALPHLKIYAEAEDSADGLEELAIAFLNLADYKAAERIFKKLAKHENGKLTASFGRALIAYKQGKPFISLLDDIYEEDPDWVIDKIKNDWDYKLPEFSDSDENKWNAAVAARYLGFERPFDLTRKAFSDEIPSYFDAEKGTIRFVKSELDAWVEIVNKFGIEETNFKTYPDRLTKAEIDKSKPAKKRSTKKSSKEKSAKVD
jgi:tetratricopeptide (TPR) repeat protein